jgi:hypothetical protein
LTDARRILFQELQTQLWSYEELQTLNLPEFVLLDEFVHNTFVGYVKTKAAISVKAPFGRHGKLNHKVIEEVEH